MTKNNNIPNLPFDIIEYINDIKEQEEKLDEIEKQQKIIKKELVEELVFLFQECIDDEIKILPSIFY